MTALALCEVTPPAIPAGGTTPAAADGEMGLTAALLAGDPRAAAAAWTSLSPMVRSLLGRYFGPGPERQDLCQEVFLRFFARIHELRNPRALRAFLIGICLGVAQNALRRDRRRGWLRLTSSGDLPDVAIDRGKPGGARGGDPSLSRDRGGERR